MVPGHIRNQECCLIGCGAVGRNIALQLTSMGIKFIDIYDFDAVEEHNVSSQGFLNSDIGKPKVDAIQDFCRNVNPDTKIYKHNQVWRPSGKMYNYVFLAADCMNVRKNAARYFHNRRKKTVLIDTRMRGEDVRVITTHDRRSRIYYEQTLFTNDQAADGNCTSSTTIYCAVNTASEAVQSMVNHLRRGIVTTDVSYNLGNGLRQVLRQ